MNGKCENLVLRSKIVGLFEAGIDEYDIADQLCVNVKTVKKWVKRHKEGGDLRDRPRSGGPRCTEQQMDREIIREVNANPFTTAKEIQKKLNLACSDDTIRRRLHEAGISLGGPPVKQKRLEGVGPPVKQKKLEGVRKAAR